MATMAAYIDMYVNGPRFSHRDEIAEPALLAGFLMELWTRHRHLHGAYVGCFFDEATHEFKEAGDMHPAWIFLNSEPEDTELVRPEITAAAASLTHSRNSFFALHRKPTGVIGLIVKKTDLPRAAAALSKLPKELTGRF